MWLVLIEVEINGIKTRLEIYKLRDNITNLGIEDEQSGRSSGRSIPAMTNPSDSTSKPGATSEVHTN